MMKYKRSQGYSPQKEEKIGVLISNLGTPQSASTKDLRIYLAEFLSDPRVVEIPRLLWWLILHGVILRFRPKKSARIYQSIWSGRGSPLMIHTQDQTKALSSDFKTRWGEQVQVDFAMRYGEPSFSTQLQKMADQDIRKLLIVPLYPQYASATIGATFDAIAEDYTHRRWIPQLRFVSGYHNFSPYINALVMSIKAFWDKNGRADKLILSFHGLPQYTHDKGDPYFAQCHETTSLLVQALELKEDQYLMTFQSRFGKAEWLKPYTEQSLKSLAQEGVKSIQVVCPGFSSDCIETIEEIDVENRDYFLAGGGERYDYIPALNASEEHIEVLSALVAENLKGWV